MIKNIINYDDLASQAKKKGSWMFCFRQWQLGDVLCFLSERDGLSSWELLRTGCIFLFSQLVSGEISDLNKAVFT